MSLPSYYIGVLPASFVELLGGIAGLPNDAIGDPAVPSELGVAVLGGLLVKWASKVQSDVAVPLLGGAVFSRSVTDLSQPNSITKAILASFVASLLANPGFVDATTGANGYAAAPQFIVNPQSTYPTIALPTQTGVLPASFLELLGDGTNDGDVIGDPLVPSEVVAGVIGGNLVKWVSPWQSDVAVPLLGGACFSRFATAFSQRSAAIKAIVSSFYDGLLANPNFFDAITGNNAIAAAPATIVNPSSRYPTGGLATVPQPISAQTCPSAGPAVPWSPANSLALAWATDQFFV